MPRVRIFLFGPPRVESGGHPVELKRRKTAALLAYLAYQAGPVSREALAGLFWPEASQSAAFAYLRHTIWEIGALLGPCFLTLERDQVSLAQSAEIWVDALRFDRLLAEAKTAPSPAPLEEAIGLYQAAFLDRFVLKDCEQFEAWQREQAETLQRCVCEALATLAQTHLEQKDLDRALLHGRRWLGFDPLNEAAHRLIIQAELLAGRRAAAMRQYETCARLLSAELGIEPSAATRGLVAEIRAEPPAPAASAPLSPAAALPDRAAPMSARRTADPLPASSTPFIGRKMELGEIAYRLKDPQCRLLTLLGPGGIGKTRLSLHAAQELAPAYPDGVFFIALETVTDCAQFLPAIQAALLPSASPQLSPAEQIAGHIRDKAMLWILDNMEHLSACAAVLNPLLAASPGLNILVTSRERLNLPAEWCLEIGGMSFPLYREGGYETYSAVQLFLQTARRVKSGFQPCPEDREAIAAICRLMEGMPLGIELAAAWTRLLSPADILREIETNLDFLTSSQRGIAERHRSLRTVYEGARELLAPAEKAAFSRLAALPGKFSRAQALAAGVDLPLLSTLVDKTLVRFHPDGTYDMHQVLRKFAGEQA